MDEKKYLEKYATSYEAKLEILYDLLRNKYSINSKEKLEELIAMYQKVVDKKIDNERKQNKTITITLSAFVGVLSLSFTNLEVLGIDFKSWLILAVSLVIMIGLTTMITYAITYYDTIKRKYEMMIKDLEELRLKKF